MRVTTWTPGSLVAQAYWTIRSQANGVDLPVLAGMLGHSDTPALLSVVQALEVGGYVVQLRTGVWAVQDDCAQPPYPSLVLQAKLLSMLFAMPEGMTRADLAEALGLAVHEVYHALLSAETRGLVTRQAVPDAGMLYQLRDRQDLADGLQPTAQEATAHWQPVAATHLGRHGRYELHGGRLTVECRQTDLQVTLHADVTRELFVWLDALVAARS
jgi:hypothetical protein